MKKLFENYGYNLSEKQLALFNEYYGILTEYNQKFNLTAITEKNEVYIKHFIDSLSGAEFVSGEKLTDIGSGGGFPSIPLKILLPEIKLTMVEATEKKCGFLKEAAKFLKLSDVTVVNARAEDIAKDKNFRESSDTVTARAVAKLDILSELCLPFVKKGGKFIAYKGKAEEELSAAENAVKILGGEFFETKKFSLNGDERTLVVIKKVKNTPDVYPRTNAKIRKKPL